MSKGRIITDPHTGQQLIVFELPGPPAVPDPYEPQTQPPMYQPQPQYPPPAYYDPNWVQQPPPRQRRRRERRSRRAADVSGGILFFFLSWIPTGMGFPGLTLLCWGLLLAWIVYRAIR